MAWVAARLREPSTYGGLIAIGSLITGKVIGGDTAAAIQTVGVSLGGLIACLIPEKER
jgi:hypothetical protein